MLINLGFNGQFHMTTDVLTLCIDIVCTSLYFWVTLILNTSWWTFIIRKMTCQFECECDKSAWNLPWLGMSSLKSLLNTANFNKKYFGHSWNNYLVWQLRRPQSSSSYASIRYSRSPLDMQILELRGLGDTGPLCASCFQESLKNVILASM